MWGGLGVSDEWGGDPRCLGWATGRKQSPNVETEVDKQSGRKMNSHSDICWRCLSNIQIEISSRQECLQV